MRDFIVDGINFDLVQLNSKSKNPVENPPMNNWSVNQPSPPHSTGMQGNEDLGVRDITIDGVNGFDFVQTANPVENPPFNNWSVHQPSPPHDFGMKGNEDLGQDIILDGHHIHFSQKDKKDVKLAQIIPIGEENKPGNFMI